MKPTRVRGAVVAAVTLACTVVLAQTTVYRWVDSEGRVHFTDQPPSEEHRELTQRRIGGGYVGSESRPPPANLASVVQRFPVVLYTSAECGEPCRLARDMLMTRGVPFSERSVQSGPDVADELIKRAGGLYVPALGVGPNTLRGFEESAWRTVLDTAGYPGMGGASPAPPGTGRPAASGPPAR